MDVLKDISRISRDLMLNEPFYGLFLSTLNKVTRKDLETAGVCKKGINTELAVNPEFWETKLTEATRYGVLKHELLHLCFFHLILRDKYSDKLLANIAMDIEINQYIDPKYKNEMFLHLKSFNGIELEPFQGTDYYYNKLLKEKDTNEDLKGLIAQNSHGLSEHDFWGEFEKLSESEKKLVQKQIEYQVKEIANQIKSRGIIPGELKDMIDGLLTPKKPVLNWKAYLRRFVGGSNKIYTKKIRRKSSKRFEDNPGLKIKQKRRILVGIDTSGSVSNKELQEFMQEIHHIYKTGTKITLAYCDTDINKVEEYDGKLRNREVYGRGGTDFQPIIDYYDKHKSQFCTLIYLTDGECSPPSKPKKKMLWVLSSTSKENKDLPYFTIQIPVEDAN